MTKSPKKAATPSWRTLMRRAKNTKLPKAERMQLREQAASLRRDERKAAKRTVAVKKGRQEFVQAMSAGIDRGASQGWQVQTPGRGEIVGGEISKLADTLAELARKKGGTDAVQRELAQMLATARYEGQKVADDRNMDSIKAIHEAQRIAVVAAFMAGIEAMAKENGGPLPKMVSVSGFVLAHVMDTLAMSGYSTEGRHQ